MAIRPARSASGSRSKKRSGATGASPRRAAAGAKLVRAHAIFRQPAPIQGASTAIDHARSMFITRPSDRQTSERARAALERHGFKVVAQDDLSLTIEADPALFAKVFASRLSRPRTAAKAMATSGVFPQQAWRFANPPSMPDDLRELIAEIALPAPKVILR